jgi:hypothetical protein
MADRLDFTTDQKEMLKRLKKASRCIPKGLAHELLGFSERRRKALAVEAEADLLVYGVLALVPLVVCLIVFILSWGSTKWEGWS